MIIRFGPPFRFGRHAGKKTVVMIKLWTSRARLDRKLRPEKRMI